MSVIEQIRLNLKDRLDRAEEPTLMAVAAVLSIEDPIEDDDEYQYIPQWQRDESLRRRKEMEENPSTAIPLDDLLEHFRNYRK